MENERSCRVCLNEFKSEGALVPLVLHTCGHNICTDCSQKNMSPGGEVCCTQCCKASTAPLSKNFELMRTLIGEELSSSSDPNKGIKVCDECHQSTPSVTCVECAMSTCKSCDIAIHKHELKQHHTREQHTSSSPEHFICEMHVEPLDMFCLKCKVPVCSDCISTTHVRHKHQKLETAATERRSQLQKLIEDAKKKQAHALGISQFIGNYLSTAVDTPSGNQAILRGTKATINSHFEKLHEALHNRRKELMSQVDAAFEKRVGALRNQHEEASEIAAMHGRAIDTAEKGIDFTNALLCKDFVNIRSQLKKATERDIATTVGAVCDLTVPVAFEPEERVLLGLAKLVGHVDSTSSTAENVPSVPSLISMMQQVVTAPDEPPRDVGGGAGRVDDPAGISGGAVVSTRSSGSSKRVGGNTPASVVAKGSVKDEEDVDDRVEHIGRIYQTELRYNDLYVGMKLDVLDTANRWAEGEVSVKALL